IRVRNCLGKDYHDRVSADVRTAPADLAVSVEHDAIGRRVASREPGLARKGLFRRRGIRLALGELLAGDAADEPCVAGQFVMHTFEQVRARSLGAPTTVERPTVHTGGHEADDVWFHANPRWTKLDAAGLAESLGRLPLRLGRRLLCRRLLGLLALDRHQHFLLAG